MAIIMLTIEEYKLRRQNSWTKPEKGVRKSQILYVNFYQIQVFTVGPSFLLSAGPHLLASTMVSLTQCLLTVKFWQRLRWRTGSSLPCKMEDSERRLPTTHFSRNLEMDKSNCKWKKEEDKEWEKNQQREEVGAREREENDGQEWREKLRKERGYCLLPLS